MRGANHAAERYFVGGDGRGRALAGDEPIQSDTEEIRDLGQIDGAGLVLPGLPISIRRARDTGDSRNVLLQKTPRIAGLLQAFPDGG